MSAIEMLQASPATVATLFLLLGLLVGSFLNVVIYRLPVMLKRDWRAQSLEILAEWAQEQGAPPPLSQARAALENLQTNSQPGKERYNLVVPRSACPSCGHGITALENVPVLSWLWLRGRCSACGAAISRRYPIVEAVTGLISGYVGWRFGFTPAAAGGLLLCWALLALALIDLDTMYLPDDITLPILWLGLLFNLLCSLSPGFYDALRYAGWPITDGADRQLGYAVIGAAAGYLFLWSVYWAFKIITGRIGMGYGDFKLLGAIGAWFGYVSLFPVILLSSIVGAVVGIGLILFWKHARDNPIPFGPYLAGAGLIYIFYAHELARQFPVLFITRLAGNFP
jgi:leader peptidase (prepilin peptidase)/N-methyltransferase